MGGLEHEKRFFASLMLDPGQMEYAILAGVVQGWFNHHVYQILWKGMVERYNNGNEIDPGWASIYLREKTGKSFAIEISNVMSRIVNIKREITNAIEIMRNSYIRKQFTEILRDTERSGYTTDPLSLTDRAIKQLIELRDQYSTVTKDDVVDAIKTRISTGVKIPTGYHKLDHITRGIEPYLWIIAGDSGHLKTTLALNIAYNVVEKGHPVHIFSGEMSGALLAEKMAIMKTGMNTRLGIPTEQRDFFVDQVKEVQKMPLYITETVSLPQIRIEMSKRRAQLYIIDYLQIMNTDYGHRTREQEVSDLIRDLARMRTEYGVCIMAISSLNRAEREKDRAPALRNLKDSGSIEYGADYVLFLYYKYRTVVFDRQETIEPEEEWVLRGFMAKNRVYGFEEPLRFEYDKKSLRLYEKEEEK